MDEQERKIRYEEQTEELYAAIGRFSVKFEHVCESMTSGIWFMLNLAGLRNQRIAEAVLAGLTADPLRKMFAAVLAETCKDRLDNSEKRIIADVMKRIVNLTATRNDIIHRTWFVGWALESQEDFSRVQGWKYTNTANGADFRPLNYTKAEFNQLSEQADELAKLVNRLWITALEKIKRNLTFTENFFLDAEGTVRLPPPP